MKNKLHDIMNSEKGPTKIKLSLYMVFLVFIVLFLALSGSFTTNNTSKKINQPNEKVNELTFGDKQSKLLNDDFFYKYTFDVGETIIFDGKVQSGLNTGYKESPEGIVKYRIEGEDVYKINGNQSDKYDDLYLNIDKEKLRLDKIFNILNSNSAVIERKSDETVYTYNIGEENYVVYTDKESIIKMEINQNENKYTYEFSY